MKFFPYITKNTLQMGSIQRSTLKLIFHPPSEMPVAFVIINQAMSLPREC